MKTLALLIALIFTTGTVLTAAEGQDQVKDGKPAKHAKAKKKVKKPKASKEAHIHYTCPMHPDVDAHAAGPCPKCGMDLVAKK